MCSFGFFAILGIFRISPIWEEGDGVFSFRCFGVCGILMKEP